MGRAVLALGLAMWGGLTVTALAAVDARATRPGEAAEAPLRIAPTGRPTMLVFAHTRCPCTRATIHELDRLLVRIGDRADVSVVFSGPDGGDIRDEARAIRGVHVIDDPDRAETKRFGARTSGDVLLYGADGALLFAGGITPARGHEGDSAGAKRIEELLRSRANDVTAAPARAAVFGCALFESRNE